MILSNKYSFAICTKHWEHRGKQESIVLFSWNLHVSWGEARLNRKKARKQGNDLKWFQNVSHKTVFH